MYKILQIINPGVLFLLFSILLGIMLARMLKIPLPRRIKDKGVILKTVEVKPLLGNLFRKIFLIPLPFLLIYFFYVSSSLLFHKDRTLGSSVFAIVTMALVLYVAAKVLYRLYKGVTTLSFTEVGIYIGTMFSPWDSFTDYSIRGTHLHLIANFPNWIFGIPGILSVSNDYIFDLKRSDDCDEISSILDRHLRRKE